MFSESESIIFHNKAGLNLFGILQKPKINKYPDKAIIILSPGIKSRVAPHRLYIKMARIFSDMGFIVFRFDFYGLGDSEGEIEETLVADLYGSIQVGRFKQDTIDAIDWIDKNLSISKIILFGLCGGALTGLLSGELDKRVISLIGIGMPVILDSAKALHQKFITQGELNKLRSQYIKKLISPKAWLRFFMFKSDYKIFIKSIFLPVTKRIRKKQQELNKLSINPKIEDNTNPKFASALFNFAVNKKILLIFSENDRLYWEFEEKYLNRNTKDFNEIKKNIDVIIIKEANHILSFKKWQVETFDIIVGWIKNKFSLN